VIFVDDCELVVLILVELLTVAVVAIVVVLDVVEVLEEVVLEEVVLEEVVLEEVVLEDVVLEEVVLEDVVILVVEDWTKTLLEEEGWMLLEMLELVGVEAPRPPELTSWPLHEPEILILCQLPLSSPYMYSLPQL